MPENWCLNYADYTHKIISKGTSGFFQRVLQVLPHLLKLRHRSVAEARHGKRHFAFGMANLALPALLQRRL